MNRLEQEELDRANKIKIQCPLLVLWGKKGVIERKYNVLETWKEKAINVRGKSLDCGHFLPEEAPEETYFNIFNFFRNQET